MMVLEEFLALILALFLIGFISVSSSFSSMMSSKYFCSSPINFKSCLCMVGDAGNSADLVGSLSVFCTPSSLLCSPWV